MKANAAVPLWPEMNHVSEKPADPLTLAIHPADDAPAVERELYEDAGDGFAHENGEYARRTVRCETGANSITVNISAREGSYAPERGSVVLELRGVSARPQSVIANGEAADFEHESGTLRVTLPESASATAVEVRT